MAEEEQGLSVDDCIIKLDRAMPNPIRRALRMFEKTLGDSKNNRLVDEKANLRVRNSSLILSFNVTLRNWVT